MGVVYLAREVSLERRVALKLLTPDHALQPDAKQRFLQEARTAAQLWHPGIIPIFSVDEVRDFVFFAMAYVEGQTLGQRVRGDGPLSYTAVARMLEEVARALDYAHARGVVHRDVKPDNILIELRSGRALVSDFGIARVNGGGSTDPRRVVGTAEFMSPEQAVGGPVDARSDLYSLGVVGFFALPGRLPFDGPDAMAVLAFVTEARQLSTASVLYGALASIALPLLVLRFLDVRDAQPRVALVAGALAIVAAPIAVMLARVRRLVRAGFGHRDLTDALRAELFHRREELAFLYGEGPSRLERVSRRVCYLTLAIAAGTVAAIARTPALAARPFVPMVWAAATIVALLAAVVARGRTEHRTDPKGERRLRFWSGPPGRWLFALAKLRLRVTPPPGARGA